MPLPESTLDVIDTFIREFVGDKDVVLGISGGIDSMMVGYLLLRNLKPEKVHLFSLPYGREDPDVQRIEEFLKRDITRIQIDEFVKPFKELVDDRKSLGNVMARIRMIILYSMANKMGALVAGTSNKSELLTGYFTKFGDGASDFQPLGDIYKTQIFELARSLNFPDWIIEKKPSANLWEGQTDEGELGISYEELDKILICREYLKLPEQCSESTGIPMEKVLKVYKMVNESKHKRIILYIPKINFRSVGTDWLE